MNNKEVIKKEGDFWLPSSPEKKIPGILSIEVGGDIILKTEGLLDESSEGINKVFNEVDGPVRILGFAYDQTPITLEDCSYLKTNSFYNGNISEILVNCAILGAIYDVEQKILFTTFMFSAKGLDKWVGFNGLIIDDKKEKRTASILRSPRNEMLFNLKNGMRLSISVLTTTNKSTLEEAKKKLKVVFKLESDNKRSRDDFLLVAIRIVLLLSFAIDQVVSLDQITATAEKNEESYPNDKNELKEISLYYPNVSFSENERIITRNRMLFTYWKIYGKAEEVIKKWLDVFEKIEPALNLYFSTKTGINHYMETRFLALVQGFETYHRRTSSDKEMKEDDFRRLMDNLIESCPIEHKEFIRNKLKYANEISLAKRLKKTISPFQRFFSNNEDNDRLIRIIVDTRNYLTHYDSNLEEKAFKGFDLFPLCEKMEAIFKLLVFKELGFSDEEIDNIINDNAELRRILEYQY